MRRSRKAISALIAKGDRDFLTDVEAVRAELERAVPGVSFLGEEEGGNATADLLSVLDQTDRKINFMKDRPLRSISLALVDPVKAVVAIRGYSSMSIGHGSRRAGLVLASWSKATRRGPTVEGADY